MNIHLISQHNSGIGHFRRTALVAQALSDLPGVRVFHAVCGVDTPVIPSDERVQRVSFPRCNHGARRISPCRVWRGSLRRRLRRNGFGC